MSQFDVYVMAGAGSIKLDSQQKSSLLSLGSGVGLWLTQHITTRFEVRYQTYKDQTYASDPQINMMSLQFGIGFLL